EQATRMPDAVAVLDGERALTYAELNASANRLARCLRARGVGPDTLVGICLERSAEMLVALLAVLKAGGAYLPIDPSYPADRIEFLIQDSGVHLLVTRTAFAGRFGANGTATLCIDTAANELAVASDANLDPVTGPEN